MTNLMITQNNCELCERDRLLTFHHLIPKKLHSKKKYRKLYTSEQLKTNGINICKHCHKQLHVMFDHKYLAEHLNTLAKILNNEKIIKFINWVKKQ